MPCNHYAKVVMVDRDVKHSPGVYGGNKILGILGTFVSDDVK